MEWHCESGYEHSVEGGKVKKHDHSATKAFEGWQSKDQDPANHPWLGHHNQIGYQGLDKDNASFLQAHNHFISPSAVCDTLTLAPAQSQHMYTDSISLLPEVKPFQSID